MDELYRPIKTVLPNGMTVVSERTEKRGIIGGEILFRCGAAQAHLINKNWTGLAHFDEHLVANGASKKFKAKQAKQTLSDKFYLFPNAYTTHVNTRYFTDGSNGHILPKERFWDAIKIAADGILFPKYDNKTIDHERKRILEEYDRGRTKSRRDNERYIAALYGVDYMKLAVLGESKAQIQSYERSDFIAYSHYRHPENLIISLAGDIAHREALHRVEEIFKTQLAPLKIPHVAHGKIQPGEFRAGSDGANKGLIRAGLTASAAHTRDEDYDASYIAYLGMQSLLKNKIMEKFGLYEAGFSYNNRFDVVLSANFSFEIVTGESSKANEALLFGLAFIRSTKTHRLIGQMHCELINKTIALIKADQTSVQTEASQLNTMEACGTPMTATHQTIRKYQKVSTERVQKALQNMFKGNVFLNVRADKNALKTVASVDRLTRAG